MPMTPYPTPLYQMLRRRHMHSKHKLAEALRSAGYHEMATLADAGHYHDYESTLILPDLTLLDELRKKPETEARNELIDRHMSGEFDATLEESDAWVRSPEGQKALGRLIGNKGDRTNG